MSVANIYLQDDNGLDAVTSIEHHDVTSSYAADGGYLVPGSLKLKHSRAEARNDNKKPKIPSQILTVNGGIMKQQEREGVVGFKGHDYEELPSTGCTFLSNDYLHTTEMPTNLVPGTFGVQIQQPVRSYRRRDNPLYDSNRFKSESSSTSTIQQSQVLSHSAVFLLIGLSLLVTAVALVLSIISISMATAKPADPSKLTASDISIQVQRLETNVFVLQTQLNQLMAILNGSSPEDSTLLTAKVDNLLSLTSSHDKLLKQLNQSDVALNESVFTVKSLVKTQQLNITSQLNELILNLNGRIENVTKMPGPQGPSGAGNLSACNHYVNSSGSSSAFAETLSGVVDLLAPGPTQGWVMTGALCTTTGGTQAMLKYNINLPSVYQCICKGVDSGAISRYCELHYWVCPKVS
jgi:hypothetical protein